MRRTIPFPPRLVEISAKNAKESLDSRKGKRAGDHVTKRIAAYRLPDGRVQAAYDPYEPFHPEGAMPGLADLHSRLKYYPNDTSGYAGTCSNFIPAHEILRDAPLTDAEARYNRWDELSIAHIREVFEPHREAFICALGEDQMAGWLDRLKASVVLTHVTPVRHGMDDGEPPAAIFMARTSFRSEIHVGSSLEALADGLKCRFNFIPGKDLDPAAFIAAVIDHGARAGWTTSFEQIETPDRRYVHPVGVNRAAAEILGETPVKALLRAPEPIAIALVEHGDRQVIVHARDRESLTGHIARAALTLTGRTAGEFAGMKDQAIIDRIWQEADGFFIWEGEGAAHLGYGTRPAHFAVARITFEGDATPQIRVTAASSRDSLENPLSELLGDLMPEVAANADLGDIIDAAFAHDDVELTVMSREEIRRVLAASPETPEMEI
ncbi:hypothetical protein [Defluviimonas salinarum]|uniref:Uncharacterized protein n=1 Tax=Defluviimonas salinarum TaxID=2992147 RepID=A0ABT3J5P7_9RHOB|nr:hypothetical protein [Defluviimonas salinarum]MCW3783020.1 hypothetical protein [Defluviimonas salinarum]